ncbi:MAG: 2-oxoglutarate dehydrogenase complex dihydrolipoyllysine-residue succinyltransferase [Verrucomicrobia bacterium]|nr:2-oxoglutarate dehydrogenase complex dihydrolipoyllysine-residue succinyltransferase [Verrucomicrobiota bacterium]
MSIEIKIPALGESITGGVLSTWLKQNGDVVTDGEPLFTLETDKISTEIPAPGAGRITINVEAGSEVKIGEVVGVIDAAPAEAAGSPPAAAPSEAAASAPATPSSSPTAAPAPHAQPTQPAEPAEPADVPLPPSVRRLVEEEKVPLEQVSGTGKRGQPTKTDIIDFLEKRAAAPGTPSPAQAPAAAQPPAKAPEPAPAGPVQEGRVTRRKLTPLRRKIAAQLVMAQHNAAMLTTFNECDMSAVMSLRSKYQESFQKRHGVKIGFMSFFIKAAVDALQAVPAINARLDGDDLIENHFYDIGVAVGTPRGLVVPVVRNADQKSFAELENNVADFASRARDGKLQLADLTGGVFTITNGGIYGSLLSTPILNPPQSGILGMHKIQNRPVAIGDKVEVRPMMYLALSYDHRVVDGKEAVTFLVRLKECIEDPTRLLLQG